MKNGPAKEEVDSGKKKDPLPEKGQETRGKRKWRRAERKTNGKKRKREYEVQGNKLSGTKKNNVSLHLPEGYWPKRSEKIWDLGRKGTV